MPLATIALGANLPSPAGPPDATLAAVLPFLASNGHIAARSALYSTAPVGFAAQPRFLNAVVALSTDLPPRILLDALLSIERHFGRDRSAALPNGPRTLDLDLLLYGDLVLSEFDLEIPHPRLAQRAFVLVPLVEIAPIPSIPAPVSPPLNSSPISLPPIRARSSASQAPTGPATSSHSHNRTKAPTAGNRIGSNPISSWKIPDKMSPTFCVPHELPGSAHTPVLAAPPQVGGFHHAVAVLRIQGRTVRS